MLFARRRPAKGARNRIEVLKHRAALANCGQSFLIDQVVVAKQTETGKQLTDLG
jgi:hypothetical protein